MLFIIQIFSLVYAYKSYTNRYISFGLMFDLSKYTKYFLNKTNKNTKNNLLFKFVITNIVPIKQIAYDND